MKRILLSAKVGPVKMWESIPVVFHPNVVIAGAGFSAAVITGWTVATRASTSDVVVCCCYFTVDVLSPFWPGVVVLVAAGGTNLTYGGGVLYKKLSICMTENIICIPEHIVLDNLNST
jgi:hypothetical protein